MEIHPAAELFPLMNEEELAALVEDIRVNGQREPIVMHQGKILDGRNRYRACELLGITPQCVDWDQDGAAVDYVVSLNLHRRHLSASQRAVLAHDLLPWYECEAKKRQVELAGTRPNSIPDLREKMPEGERARDEAAHTASVNPRYVQDVKHIAQAAPSLIDKMRSGEVTISEAKKEVRRVERAEAVAEKIARAAPDDDAVIFADFTPQIYSVWNFPTLTNRTTVFGSVPQEIIDNLLYYFTKPHDVVFDPFGGGGSTIDKCLERKRQPYVYDLSPIPERPDIRQHDITTGLPDDLPSPDLVFLDPPYWKQAAGRYSDKPTDMGNVALSDFLDNIESIAENCVLRSEHGCILALICGPCKEDGLYIDLPFLCYERITKHMAAKQRIVVPYSTQVHGGAFVEMAKQRKEILYLARDLMLFEA